MKAKILWTLLVAGLIYCGLEVFEPKKINWVPKSTEQVLTEQVDYLETLSNQNIVLILHNAGVKGRQHDCNECVVANWLRTLFPNEKIHVSIDGIKVGKSHIDMPRNLFRFIKEFDNGEYPVLIQ